MIAKLLRLIRQACGTNLDNAYHLPVAVLLDVLDLVEPLRLLFAARVAGASIELEQPKIGRIVILVFVQGLIEVRSSFCKIAKLNAYLAQFRKRIGLIRAQCERLLQLGCCSIKMSFLESDAPEIVVRIRGRLFAGDSLLEPLRCGVVVLSAKIGLSQREQAFGILRTQGMISGEIRKGLRWIL